MATVASIFHSATAGLTAIKNKFHQKCILPEEMHDSRISLLLALTYNGGFIKWLYLAVQLTFLELNAF